MATYSGENQDAILSAKQQDQSKSEHYAYVQISLDPPSARAAESVGLVVASNSASVWTCPNRPGLPSFEEYPAERVTAQWTIGYQYFGGIKTWMNPSFPKGIPSRSPVKFSQARPTWCLAADAIIKIRNEWGKISKVRPLPYSNLPPHPAPSKIPIGGNEVFADGSAQWIKFEEMHYLTTWQPDFTARQCFFYQDSSDFAPELVSVLPLLSARNFR